MNHRTRDNHSTRRTLAGTEYRRNAANILGAHLLGLLIIGITLTGCTVGRDFHRPSPETLKLGETTVDQVSARYGAPWRTGTMTVNDTMVQTRSYAYAGGGEPLVAGVTPARAIDLSFVELTLVGYIFQSSYQSDHTDYDEALVAGFEEGRTRCAEIEQALGPAHGRYIYPLVEARDHRQIVYSYPHVKMGFMTPAEYLKRVSVECDRAGIVVSIAQTSIGQR